MPPAVFFVLEKNIPRYPSRPVLFFRPGILYFIYVPNDRYASRTVTEPRYALRAQMTMEVKEKCLSIVWKNSGSDRRKRE